MPLEQFIAGQPTCLGWEGAGEDVTSRLPVYLHRAGIEGADVNDTVLGALRSAFREILTRPEFRASVVKLQAETESALQAAALGLCTAIEAGVDGISGVEVIPQVSFRDPVSSAQLFASHDGQRIPFEQSGTRAAASRSSRRSGSGSGRRSLEAAILDGLSLSPMTSPTPHSTTFDSASSWTGPRASARRVATLPWSSPPTRCRSSTGSPWKT